jgi:hypothetical protein
MKKLVLVLAVFLLLFDSCSKCKDVSVGSVALMPNSSILLNSLKGKTLTYKDSLGNLIRFKSAQDIEVKNEKVITKTICREAFDNGVEFLDTKTNHLEIIGKDLNFNQNLSVNFAKRTIDSIVTDTLLYDVLDLKVGIISFELELSKRGTSKPDYRTNFKPIDSLNMLGKTFKNVVLSTNSQKTRTQEPLELYFNLNQGVVAMRLLDGRLFVLDKIE